MPAPTRIQKAGNGHSYFLDGQKVPGVTTVLNNGIPKPGLINWAANVTAAYVVNGLDYDADTGQIVADRMVQDLLDHNATQTGRDHVKIPPGTMLPMLALETMLTNVRYKDRDDAGRAGTAVHGYAEALARGESVTPPEHLRGHVEAYAKFLDEWGPTNALLERVVVNRRWQYMGKFDLFAEFPGKVWSSGPWAGRPVGPGLLDVKTTRSGIYPETGLQLAAYAGAETMLEGSEEIPVPRAEWIGAIHVRADGYDVVPFDVRPGDPNDPAFRAFLYAKMVGDFFKYPDGPAQEMRLDAAERPRVAG